MAHVTHNCQDGSIGTRQACDNNGPRVKQQQKDVLTIPGMFNFHGGVAIRFWQNIMRQGYYSTYIIAISFIPCHRHPTADIPRPLLIHTHSQLILLIVQMIATNCFLLGFRFFSVFFCKLPTQASFFYFIIFKNDRQIVNLH